MADPSVTLTVTGGADGLGLPLRHGDCRLTAQPVATASLIAPYPGRVAACSAALAALGLAFPAPGQGLSAQGARIVWAGREQAFLFDAAPPDGLAEHASLTDQADGWARFLLQGTGAEAVLARLVPLDLRAGSFPQGRVVRSLLGHMPLLLIRAASDAFEITTYRSMAGSAVHELGRAMRATAARG